MFETAGDAVAQALLPAGSRLIVEMCEPTPWRRHECLRQILAHSSRGQRLNSTLAARIEDKRRVVGPS